MCVFFHSPSLTLSCWAHSNVLILCRWIMRVFKLSEILLGFLVHSIVKCMAVLRFPRVRCCATPHHTTSQSYMMQNVSVEQKFFHCKNHNNACDYGNNVSQGKKSECINLFPNTASTMRILYIFRLFANTNILSSDVFFSQRFSFCRARNFRYHLFPFSICKKKARTPHTHT